MSIIHHGPLKQIGNIRSLFTHSSWTRKFGWSYIHSRHYVHESMFTLGIFVGYIVHPSITPLHIAISTIDTIEDTNTIHNIRTVQIDIVRYLYGRQILPIF